VTDRWDSNGLLRGEVQARGIIAWLFGEAAPSDDAKAARARVERRAEYSAANATVAAEVARVTATMPAWDLARALRDSADLRRMRGLAQSALAALAEAYSTVPWEPGPGVVGTRLLYEVAATVVGKGDGEPHGFYYPTNGNAVLQTSWGGAVGACTGRRYSFYPTLAAVGAGCGLGMSTHLRAAGVLGVSPAVPPTPAPTRFVLPTPLPAPAPAVPSVAVLLALLSPAGVFNATAVTSLVTPAHVASGTGGSSAHTLWQAAHTYCSRTHRGKPTSCAGISPGRVAARLTLPLALAAVDSYAAAGAANASLAAAAGEGAAAAAALAANGTAPAAGSTGATALAHLELLLDPYQVCNPRCPVPFQCNWLPVALGCRPVCLSLVSFAPAQRLVCAAASFLLHFAPAPPTLHRLEAARMTLAAAGAVAARSAAGAAAQLQADVLQDSEGPLASTTITAENYMARMGEMQAADGSITSALFGVRSVADVVTGTGAAYFRHAPEIGAMLQLMGFGSTAAVPSNSSNSTLAAAEAASSAGAVVSPREAAMLMEALGGGSRDGVVGAIDALAATERDVSSRSTLGVLIATAMDSKGAGEGLGARAFAKGGSAAVSPNMCAVAASFQPYAEARRNAQGGGITCQSSSDYILAQIGRATWADVTCDDLGLSTPQGTVEELLLGGAAPCCGSAPTLPPAPISSAPAGSNDSAVVAYGRRILPGTSVVRPCNDQWLFTSTWVDERDANISAAGGAAAVLAAALRSVDGGTASAAVVALLTRRVVRVSNGYAATAASAAGDAGGGVTALGASLAAIPIGGSTALGVVLGAASAVMAQRRLRSLACPDPSQVPDHFTRLLHFLSTHCIDAPTELFTHC
jgi:hypothetical protein